MITVLVILITALSYLVGCLNGADLAGRFIFKSNRVYLGMRGYRGFVREFGTAGTAIVAAFDLVRALLLTWLGGLLLKSVDCVDVGRALAGFALLMGCGFPFTNAFKGVRAPVCAIVTALMVDWRVGLFCVIVFLIVTILGKSQTLGIVGAALCYPLGVLIFKHMGTTCWLALFSAVAFCAVYGKNLVNSVRALTIKREPAQDDEL